MPLLDASLSVRLYRAILGHTAFWNRTVAKRAVKIDMDHKRYVKVLHPTKGWRYIAREHLGL